MKHELVELLRLRDARIAELEKALRQIATGGDPDGIGDGLDYSEITAIASRALMVSE